MALMTPFQTLSPLVNWGPQDHLLRSLPPEQRPLLTQRSQGQTGRGAAYRGAVGVGPTRGNEIKMATLNLELSCPTTQVACREKIWKIPLSQSFPKLPELSLLLPRHPVCLSPRHRSGDSGLIANLSNPSCLFSHWSPHVTRRIRRRSSNSTNAPLKRLQQLLKCCQMESRRLSHPPTTSFLVSDSNTPTSDV